MPIQADDPTIMAMISTVAFSAEAAGRNILASRLLHVKEQSLIWGASGNGNSPHHFPKRDHFFFKPEVNIPYNDSNR